MASLRLSRRALRDIKEIESYSIENWGKAVANEYFDSIQAALSLLKDNPGVLRTPPNFPKTFAFYRVKQHFLVCNVIEGTVFVLTIKHGAMDLPARLGELEPSLLGELKFLSSASRKQRVAKCRNPDEGSQPTS